MYKLSKKFKFAAAHRLPQLSDNHQCSKIHGHNYSVIVDLYSNKLNDDEFVIDFGDLKSFQKYLDKYFDHAIMVYNQDKKMYKILELDKKENLNIFKVVKLDFIPTSENLAKHFCNVIKKKYKKKIPGLELIVVSVEESANNIASCRLKI